MPERPLDPSTADLNTSSEALEAGLAAAFGPEPVPVSPSILQMLAASLPAVPRVQLRDLDGASPLPAAVVSAGRYQLLGEIARGGMGAVLRGRDPDLGRDIAVKVLLENHQARPELLQRFIEEAQIAGQLQHP